MPAATHIIRFIANEDNREHVGQLVDTSRDVGLDSVEGKEIKAYLINGTIFSGEVTDKVYTVKQLLSPVSRADCNYVRCLGLNYMDHAKVHRAGSLRSVQCLRDNRKPTWPFPKPQSSLASLEQPSQIHIRASSLYRKQLKTAQAITKQSFAL